MTDRRVVIYYAWSRPAETGAPLGTIEDRFPSLFELRRLRYPSLEDMRDPDRFDQGIAGFLDHVMMRNFADFAERARHQTGHPVAQIERIDGSGTRTALDSGVLDGADTLIVIGFDSLRTAQAPGSGEIAAVRAFLGRPGNLVFLGPHHDIGETPELPHDERVRRQLADFLHHGDRTIPPRQQFGGFARGLLAGLGVPVENRFGLHPAAEPDGTPSPVAVEGELDRLDLLRGVETLNLHPHLPHFERLGDAAGKLDVLVRQTIDPAAPPHPFARERATFDALLQSRAEVFAGTLLVGDATLWSSTAGGVESLRRFWTNLVERPQRS